MLCSGGFPTLEWAKNTVKKGRLSPTKRDIYIQKDRTKRGNSGYIAHDSIISFYHMGFGLLHQLHGALERHVLFEHQPGNG